MLHLAKCVESKVTCEMDVWVCLQAIVLIFLIMFISMEKPILIVVGAIPQTEILKGVKWSK